MCRRCLTRGKAPATLAGTSVRRWIKCCTKSLWTPVWVHARRRRPRLSHAQMAACTRASYARLTALSHNPCVSTDCRGVQGRLHPLWLPTPPVALQMMPRSLLAAAHHYRASSPSRHPDFPHRPIRLPPTRMQLRPSHGRTTWTCASKRPHVSGRKWAARVEPHASSNMPCAINAAGQIPLPFCSAKTPKIGRDFPGAARPVADTIFEHSCCVRPYKSIDVLRQRLSSTLSTAHNRPVASGGPT